MERLLAINVEAITYIWYRGSMKGAVLPLSRTYAKPRNMGRKKRWTERLTLPLAEGTTARMDGALEPGEARVDLIRAAIERELKRRSRSNDKPNNDRDA
jgi:hypothetical protein